MSRRRTRRLEELTDRIEDRLRDAPLGLHRVGPPASEEALARAELPEEAAALWSRWDGMDLGNEEVRLLSLADQARATQAAEAAGILASGDRVVGELGLALLVLPADPWEAGGDVVLVEEDGERAPYASSVIRLALGLVAEMSLLYDEEGEYCEGLFDEFGALEVRAERRLLRRRLDFDEDAPFPRFRLGQLLRRGGELPAARAELRKMLQCAPEFAWGHWELGRTELELGERAEDPEPRGKERAQASFAAAADKTQEPHLRALFLAWQARASEGEVREALARQVLGLDPGFVAARRQAVREALEDEDLDRAREWLELGLVVGPRDLELLQLRARVVKELEARPAGESE